jgi:4-hydroxy-tetrahydrodipicolinate reductase
MKDLFMECTYFIADALGVEDLEITAELESFTTDKKLKTVCSEVLPGTIASQLLTVEGLRDGEPFITLIYGAKVCPDEVEAGGPVGQTIEVKGAPSVKFELEGDLVEKGILSTGAQAMNAIPHVVAARPGIVTRRELPIFSPIL